MSLLFFYKAQPEFETFFDKYYGLALRTNWDMTFIQYLIYTILLGLFVSVLGVGISRFRGRRKTDSKKQLILLGVLYFLLFGVAWIFL